VTSSWVAIIGASIATFAVTNIDDTLLVTLLVARQIPLRRIVAGQYLGFAIVVLLSVFGAFATLTIPHGWFRLIGLLPLAIGLKHLRRAQVSTEEAKSQTGISSIALVTLSNGSDNIGIYVPFFSVGRAYLLLILLVYAILIAALCLLGRWLGRHGLVRGVLRRTGRWLVPVVFISMGIYILVVG
jgi:cadmium resistance protein CadD (predicted permease)